MENNGIEILSIYPPYIFTDEEIQRKGLELANEFCLVFPDDGMNAKRFGEFAAKIATALDAGAMDVMERLLQQAHEILRNEH